jgi:hypothetical protein
MAAPNMILMVTMKVEATPILWASMRLSFEGMQLGIPLILQYLIVTSLHSYSLAV